MIYEILAILPSKYSDTEIEGLVQNTNALLENAGAKVAKTEVLGKLKLAYPVKQNRHGVYVLTYVEAAAEAMKKIDQDLRLSDDIVRHVMVKRPAGIPATTFRPSSYQPPLTPEGKRASAEDRPARAKAAAPSEGEAKQKITVEELDRKLDEILDTDLGNV